MAKNNQLMLAIAAMIRWTSPAPAAAAVLTGGVAVASLDQCLTSLI
jgi:hypothetical protein